MEEIRGGLKAMMNPPVQNSNIDIALRLIEERQSPFKPFYDENFNKVGYGMDMTPAFNLSDVTRSK